MNQWKEEQDNCFSLLKDPNWELAIKEGGKKRVSSTQIGNILVVTEDGDPLKCVCSPFSVNYLGSQLSNLTVCLSNNIKGVLGVSEAALIAEIVAGIVAKHPNNRGYFWLYTNQLRALICLVLAIRNQSCMNQNGDCSDIERSEIIRLRKKFLQYPNAFILTTHSILFVQDRESFPVNIAAVEQDYYLDSSDLSKNIVDRFFYKYIEAKAKQYDQNDEEIFK